MQIETLWQQALADIELQVSRANFLTWFRQTRVLDEQNGIVRIAVPNGFAQKWLQGKYHLQILRSLRSLSQTVREVEFIIDSHLLTAEKTGVPPGALPMAPVAVSTSPQQLELPDFAKDPATHLNPRYTFDSFVVGPSNELAHAASAAVASNPGVKYNPLFVYGGVGLGKTHLLQAIGNTIRTTPTQRPLRLLYVSAEHFKKDVVAAIRMGNPERLESYKNIHVLIMDDIQFMAGKERTQVEFFHLFNLFYNTNRQIVISSDRAPKALPMIEERLRSRFEAGMIADIAQPEYETRLAILKRKAAERGLVLAEDILEYIGHALERNIRELEGALNAVEAAVHHGKVELSLKEVERLLLPLTRRPITLSLKQVVKTVADFYELTEAQIVDKSRKKEVVKPRQIAMYLLREELKISFPSIGERFSSRDHTTVMHACEKIHRELDEKTELQEEIQLIRERLYNNTA